MTTTQRIIDTIKSAQNEWTNANWPHELSRDGQIVTDESENAIICEGSCDDCDVCARATDAANGAIDLGDAAIAALKAGDVLRAADLIWQAANAEAEWGDMPAWRPALRAMESLNA